MQDFAGYRRDGVTIRKPTYYLWRKDFPTQEAFQEAKERFAGIGFRVVTFLEGQEDVDIHTGLQALIRNHWQEGPPSP